MRNLCKLHDVVTQSSVTLYPTLRSRFARIRLPRLVRHISLVLIALLGIANVYIHTSNYGPNITEDSATYISVAKNLVTGDGFLSYNRDEFILYGPGFSLLLGFLASLGVGPVGAGRFVNIIGYGIVLYLTYCWLNRHVKNTLLIIIAAISIALSYPLNSVFSYLLSDGIFIVFVVASLVSMSRFTNSPTPSWSTLAWSASFTALAATTRYIGVTVILTGIIAILMHRGCKKITSKLKYLAVYIVVSSISLAVWITRNYLSTGTLTGNREAFVWKGDSWLSALTHRLSEIYDTIYLWVWVDDLSDISYILYQIGVVITIVTLVLVGLFLSRRLSLIDLYNSPILERLPAWKPTSWKMTLPFILFSIIYIHILPIAAALGSEQGISTRYMAPIYIPILLVLVAYMDRLLCRNRQLTTTNWIVIGIILAGLFSSTNLSLQRNLRGISEALADDARVNLWGYSSDSDIIKYLRETPIIGRAISNQSAVTYWLAFDAQEPVLNIPEGYTGTECLDWVRSQHSHQQSRTYLIYYTQNRVMACPITELEPLLSPYLERVAQTSEAVIYRIINPIDLDLTIDSDLSWDVHIHDDILIYVKYLCSADSTQPPFYLHIYPAKESDLMNDIGFENLDFQFNPHGIINPGPTCIVMRPLPQYDILKIRTGQYTNLLANETLNIWEIEITPPTAALPAASQ